MKKLIGRLLDAATKEVQKAAEEVKILSTRMNRWVEEENLKRASLKKDLRKIKETPISGDELAAWKKGIK